MDNYTWTTIEKHLYSSSLEWSMEQKRQSTNQTKNILPQMSVPELSKFDKVLKKNIQLEIFQIFNLKIDIFENKWM